MIERNTWAAALNGARLRCPCCGVGRLFRAYLKVVDACAQCGEDFRHQRADDAPPYIVILIVGHLVIPFSVMWQIAYDPPFWLYASVLGTLTVALSLWLLPRAKGLVVGVQWANRMHGFGGDVADEA